VIVWTCLRCGLAWGHRSVWVYHVPLLCDGAVREKSGALCVHASVHSAIRSEKIANPTGEKQEAKRIFSFELSALLAGPAQPTSNQSSCASPCPPCPQHSNKAPELSNAHVL
jgi:hypothetical protein